jgi:hypothetical protein
MIPFGVDLSFSPHHNWFTSKEKFTFSFYEDYIAQIQSFFVALGWIPK